MLEVRQDETSEREVGRLLQRRVKLFRGHAAALQSKANRFDRPFHETPIIQKQKDPERPGARFRPFRFREERARGFGRRGFGFAFVTCRDRFTVKHGHQMSRFRDVCTLGTHDDIMHYVRTLNIYELFNDTVRPASINYALFHPSRVDARTSSARIIRDVC